MNRQRNLLAGVIDLGASAALGGAVAFAAGQFAPPVAVLAAALGAFLVSWRFLNSLPPGESQGFNLPVFDLPGLTAVEVDDELLLTAEMSVAADVAPDAADELLLEDVVAAAEADARVVQLFEPRLVPSASQLCAAIDQHLQSRPTRAPVDASAELSDALAELRRSLR